MNGRVEVDTARGVSKRASAAWRGVIGGGERTQRVSLQQKRNLKMQKKVPVQLTQSLAKIATCASNARKGRYSLRMQHKWRRGGGGRRVRHSVLQNA
jgi:hypothetical protein